MPFASNPNLRGSYAAVVGPDGDPGVDGAGDADADGDGATGDADADAGPPPADPPPEGEAAVDDAGAAETACEAGVLASHAARIGSTSRIAASIGNARRRVGRFVIGYALPDRGVGRLRRCGSFAAVIVLEPDDVVEL